MPKVEIHGYAIVSDNDCIADALGQTPAVLRNDADWAYFQAELNKSALTVLGRLGHEANPNPKGRLRMVLSSSSPGLERRADGWWWNPEGLSWDQAIRTVLPEGGQVAVPGGRQVFDSFSTSDTAPFTSHERRGRSFQAAPLCFQAAMKAGTPKPSCPEAD
jgi:hypothetical protein